MKNLVQVLIIIYGMYSIGFSQQMSPTIEKLAKDADLILTGKVTAKQSEWNADKTKIFTQVKIRVDEYLKASDSQNEIIVSHPGGEVGEVGELYSHTPSFSNDEDVLLFLKKDKKDSYKVLFGNEGKLTLYNDQTTGEKITSSNKKISVLKKDIKTYLESTR